MCLKILLRMMLLWLQIHPSHECMMDAISWFIRLLQRNVEGCGGGPVVHLCAVADSPVGPFVKHQKPIFTAEGSSFPAEDPYIWMQDGCYYAIVKDMHGSFTNAGRSLALFCSEDGFNWKPVDEPLLSTPEIRWADGKVLKLQHLERPQILFDGDVPAALFMAADTMKNYSRSGHTFNVHVPILRK